MYGINKNPKLDQKQQLLHYSVTSMSAAVKENRKTDGIFRQQAI